MSAESERNNFALVPKMPAALEKAEPGTKRVLSGMVADTLALVKRVQRPKPRIVWVDDDAELLQLMESIICDEFTVLKFQNGEEAWREIQRQTPDILITDMARPGPMDGWAMIPLLAEKRVQCPVIVVSALTEFAAENDRKDWKAVSAKFHNFLEHARRTLDIAVLSKPFENEELLKVLKGCLKTQDVNIKRLVEFELKWRLGARTGDLVVKVASQFASRITVSNGEKEIDAKDHWAFAGLGDDTGWMDKITSASLRDPSIRPDQIDSSPFDLGCGDHIKVFAEGPDAAAAMEELTELFTCGSRMEHCMNPDCSSKPCLVGYSKEHVSYSCYYGHNWNVPRSGKSGN